MGRQNYGQIFCTQCGERIGHVISKDYKYLYLVFLYANADVKLYIKQSMKIPDNTQNYFYRA